MKKIVDSYRNELTERFISYVKFNTQSDEDSGSCPSTLAQFELAQYIKNEFELMKISDIQLNEKCYLTATIPSNCTEDNETIGLIAHLDTSPDMSGENVMPLIIESYDGEKIVLNKEHHIVLDPAEFPDLKKYIGQQLIVTNGLTLLGADDKAGVAEIVTAASILMKYPEIKHGEIRICFTPDEEIGRGADFFDVQAFGADYAYTIDSGEIGSLEFETFNAAYAVVHIKGKNVHPGYAKNILINSQQVAMEFNQMLPIFQRPEFTEGMEGFYHLIKMSGNTEESTLHYIIRDHNKQHFTNKKHEMIKIADFINSRYKQKIIEVSINDSYYNMGEIIHQHPKAKEKALNAYTLSGITPQIHPIRGGTDGARLSFMGLPTPNIFAGGHNFHSRFEYIPVESMLKAVEVILNLCKSE